MVLRPFSKSTSASPSVKPPSRPLDAFYQIIKGIADNLSPEQFTTFRLVSTACSTAVKTRFCEYFFTEPIFFTSYRSFDALINICDHPEFSAHIKRIHFSTRHLECSRAEHPHQSDEEKEKARCSAAKTQERYEAQHHLLHDDRAAKLLADTLVKLKRKNIPTYLGMTDDMTGATHMNTSPLLYPVTGKQDRWETLRIEVLQMFMVATAYSKCTIAGLMMQFNAPDCDREAGKKVPNVINGLDIWL